MHLRFLKSFSSVLVCGVLAASFLGSASAYAQAVPDDAATLKNASEETLRARVIEVVEQGEKLSEDGQRMPYQKVILELLEGSRKGSRITLDHGALFAIGKEDLVRSNETVIIVKPAHALQDDFYYITDHYRLNRLYLVVGFFFLLAILFAGRRGLMSIAGLVFTAVVIGYGIAPGILRGYDPFLVSLGGGLLILTVSLYIAHGFSRRTSIALMASFITLVFAAVANYLVVLFTKVSGTGTEEAFYLQIDVGTIDLRGLLLGGIIIGVLGVLDDITTAQVAAVEEISRANPLLSYRDLYRRGLSVGKEHIASLVNTLVLAYVGASFPIILLYTLHKNVPLWLLVNGNFIAEEIVRTVVGSMALVVAVPITTGLAAYFFAPKQNHDLRIGSKKPVSREQALRALWNKE